jgi:hypothetical protein
LPLSSGLSSPISRLSSLLSYCLPCLW